jgi:hypothetical protein
MQTHCGQPADTLQTVDRFLPTHCGQRTGFCRHIADTADNIADTADNIADTADNIAIADTADAENINLHQPMAALLFSGWSSTIPPKQQLYSHHHNAFIVTRDPTFPTFQMAPNPMSVRLASREPARVPTSSEHRTTS